MGKYAWCAVNPLFSMLNHDCDPSAIWNPVGFANLEFGGALEVRAIRNIKKGEEVFVSYINHIVPEQFRHDDLIAQLGKVCECKRCRGEREDVAMGRFSKPFDLSDIKEHIRSMVDNAAGR